MLTYDSNAKRPIEEQVEFGNPACSVIFEYDDINICGTKIKIKDRTIQVIFFKDQLPEAVGNTADIENLVKEYIENPDEEHKNALLKCVRKLSVSKGEQRDTAAGKAIACKIITFGFKPCVAGLNKSRCRNFKTA